MSDTISVIVAVFRVEPYLRRCVDSILRQTHHDLEIILVDDGSPDDCGRICDDYAAADPRVRVLHQPNRGLSEARNAGLDVMTGRYVSFVDGDDWLTDGCLETLYRMLGEARADVAVCNLLRTADEADVGRSEGGETLELTRTDAIGHILKPQYGSMVATCGKLYRADLFDRIRFPAGRLHEDAFTTYRVILQADKVVLTTSALYVYWQRPDSIMGSPFNPKAKLDIIDALTERARTLRAVGMEAAAATTSGQVLATFMSIAQNAGQHPPPGDQPLNDLAKRLGGEPQPLRFTALYSLYQVAPRLGIAVYRRLGGGRSS